MSLRKSTDNQDKPLVGHFINGSEFVGDGRTADVFNPADGTVSKRVALAGEDVYQAAARASAKAFPAWRSTFITDHARRNLNCEHDCFHDQKI